MRTTLTRTNRTTRALAATLLTASVTLVAGCGSDDASEASPEVSATEHNDADVAFAGDMLQHHAQALAMVDLTLDRPLDPEVEQLAEQIRAAQAPEIETFSDWLTDWDEEIPATVRDHVTAGHGGGDVSDTMEEMEEMEEMEDGHGEHADMPGMMTAEDFAALEDAPDADFQQRWLELMVEHHEGAVEMAEAQQDEGRYQPAVELAASIAESQSTEIATMEALIGDGEG